MSFRIYPLSLTLTLLSPVTVAQNFDLSGDERVEAEVIRYISKHQTAPVVVVVGGRMRDVREVWQGLGRQIRSGYGRLAGPPNANGEFFAELNRFGLLLLLNNSQVESVYLTFEATMPGED